MRRITNEDGLALDEARLEFHVVQIPHLDTVFRRRLEHAQGGWGKGSEVALELLLVGALIIPCQAFGDEWWSAARTKPAQTKRAGTAHTLLDLANLVSRHKRH